MTVFTLLNLMKITLLSDLHLNFGGLKVTNNQEADVLVLAGDILEIADVVEQTPIGKYYVKFLKDCGKKFKKVFYVMGNHEHYFSDITTAVDKLKPYLPKNVTVLDDNSEYYEGVHFVGSTLWTNMNHENPHVINYIESQMNDYRCIKNEDFGFLTAEMVLDLHDKAVKWLDQVLPTLKQGPIVVVTHHAPHINSLSKEYNYELSAAYATDLTELIGKHQPQYWLHGHIHASRDYQVGETRIVSNPRGYNNYGENPDFDVELTIEVPVKTVKDS